MRQKGFTLVELLVVIAIIAILSTIGITSYTGIADKIREIRIRTDLDAVAKAYEVNYRQVYQPLSASQFANGSVPIPPAGGSYVVTGPDTAAINNRNDGFLICADTASGSRCTVPSGTCVCKTSTQGVAFSTGLPSPTPTPSSTPTPTSAPSLFPSTGLLAYWKLDEASWNGTLGEVIDSSGNGNNGIASCTGAGCIRPTTTNAGKLGNAGLFNTSNKTYVNVGTGFALTNGSFSAWINTTGTCGFSVCPIFSRGTTANTGYSFELWNTGGSYKITFNIRDGIQDVVGTTPVAPNQWYHVVATFNGATVKLYVNGSLDTSVTQTATPSFPTNPNYAQIGDRNSGEDVTFDGRIDELGVWSRVLTGPTTNCTSDPNNEICTLYNGGAGLTYTPPLPSPSATPAPDNPINKKALLVIYDPILSDGKKLHEERSWQDPAALVPQIISSINSSSGGFITYQVTETQNRNEWPRLIDGFRYNESTWNSCWSNPATCHTPSDMDYAQMWTDLNICSKVSSGAIDWVFIYGAPYFGFDEYAFKIPGDIMPYNIPTNPWFYTLRRKNIPDCNGKTVVAMGWSYERGVAEAIHSYGHWIENALGLTVGRGYWDSCSGHNGVPSDFDHFSCVNKDVTASTPVTVAGCGNVHFPPNGLSDYDYGNAASVQSACGSWLNYPFTTKTVASTSCSAWSCTGDTQLSFLQWWMSHLPRAAGVNSNGNLNNWWKYIVDFDNAVKEAKGP